MKKEYLNLHMDWKKICLLVVYFSVISILLSVVISVSTNRAFIQLNSLLHSDYEYTAILRKPIDQDNYYQFNTGIYFATSPHEKRSLNAEILMQDINVEYTDSIYWNAGELGNYDVAVSHSIADNYGLEIGDKLYSKHIVDGTVYEYAIAEILPDVASVRWSETFNYDEGIIIMGFDEEYVENITHHSIVFTKESVDMLAVLYSDMPERIQYRVDEILAVFKGLLPYLVLFGIFAVLKVTGLVFFITKGVAYNFKRLIVFGFEKKRLNTSYVKLVFGTGVFALIISNSVSMVVSNIVGVNPVRIIFLIGVAFLEFIVLLLAAAIRNKQLWRS